MSSLPFKTAWPVPTSQHLRDDLVVTSDALLQHAHWQPEPPAPSSVHKPRERRTLRTSVLLAHHPSLLAGEGDDPVRFFVPFLWSGRAKAEVNGPDPTRPMDVLTRNLMDNPRRMHAPVTQLRSPWQPQPRLAGVTSA